MKSLKHPFQFFLCASLLLGVGCVEETDPTPSIDPVAGENGCYLSGVNSQLGQLYSTSGNTNIDYATNEEIIRLKNSFLVDPAFYFFNDQNAPNAYATPQNYSPINADGTVMFGFTLFAREFPRSYGGTTIPIIIAHEFGHILAFKKGLKFRGNSGKYNELWADYCAGAYMFFRQFWKQTDVNASLSSFFSTGDYNFNAPNHHGTPQERYNAVLRGFTDAQNATASKGSFTLDELLYFGSQYINSL